MKIDKAEKQRAANQKHYKKYKEKILARNRNNYQKDKTKRDAEKQRAANRKHYKKYKEKMLARNRNNYQKDKTKRDAAHREWFRNNPEKQCMYSKKEYGKNGASHKQRQKNRVKELTDEYILILLIHVDKIDKENITKDMIIERREIVYCRRLLSKLRKEIGENDTTTS